jgi:DNA-binding MarR family transcriptional regulator
MANEIDPDLAIIIVGAARVIADHLGDAVAGAGIGDMRATFGYVIRALADNDRTLTELAEVLGVSKQAAIKVVDEMQARGFLTREPHPTDRRVKVLRLTDKAHAVRRTALAASRKLERDLRRRLGDTEVDAMRHGLLALLATHDGLDAALAGRSRAAW